MRQLFYSLVGLATLLVCLGPAPAQDGKPKIIRDLVYGQGGKEELKLDLAMPVEGDDPRPVILCVHGGGWRGGHRKDLHNLIKILADKGFVAATCEYRLTPKYRFPAQIEDCKAAVRWLRANAQKYRINPDQIGAVGFSAGGHLVCLLGTADPEDGLEGLGGNPKMSSKVQAVISLFGPTDFTTKTWEKGVEDFFLVPFLGGTFEEKKEEYKKASPLIYARKTAPPFLFFHGDKDPLVNIAESRKMVKKLKEVGAEARLVTMEGEGHGWIGEQLNRTLDQAVVFLEAKLKKK